MLEGSGAEYLLSEVQIIAGGSIRKFLRGRSYGSLENTGYPNGLPHWCTYFGGCRN